MARLRFGQLARGVDLGLLSAVLLLAIFGLAALYSFALNVDQPNFSFFYKQLIYLLTGIVLIIVLTRFDYRWLAGVHWILYGLGLLALVAVLIVGQTVRGSTGWFAIAGFQLEPVEFVKIIMAVVLAKYFSDHAASIDRWRTIGMSGLLTGIPVLLVMLQPDLGSAVILIGMWAGLLVSLPVSRRKILLLLLLAATVAIFSWFAVLRPYQKNRILDFVSPNRDRLGSGYNVQQAITAAGSGGWFGRGLGLGPQSQLNFLPERHTDFIFASISEELGLLGGLAIIILFGIFFWRLFRLMRGGRDNFGSLFTLSLTLMFFVQVAINLGMNLGVFPVTGLPLPFVSYGGSSLLASLMAVGLAQSLAVRQRVLPL